MEDSNFRQKFEKTQTSLNTLKILAWDPVSQFQSQSQSSRTIIFSILGSDTLVYHKHQCMIFPYRVIFSIASERKGYYVVVFALFEKELKLKASYGLVGMLSY